MGFSDREMEGNECVGRCLEQSLLQELHGLEEASEVCALSGGLADLLASAERGQLRSQSLPWEHYAHARYYTLLSVLYSAQAKRSEQGGSLLWLLSAVSLCRLTAWRERMTTMHQRACEEDLPLLQEEMTLHGKMTSEHEALSCVNALWGHPGCVGVSPCPCNVDSALHAVLYFVKAGMLRPAAVVWQRYETIIRQEYPTLHELDILSGCFHPVPAPRAENDHG